MTSIVGSMYNPQVNAVQKLSQVRIRRSPDPTEGQMRCVCSLAPPSRLVCQLASSNCTNTNPDPDHRSIIAFDTKHK